MDIVLLDGYHPGPSPSKDTARQQEYQENVAKIVRPLLEELYEKWGAHAAATKRRRYEPTPFMEWVRGRVIAPVVSHYPTNGYDPDVLYAQVATSQEYTIRGHRIKLGTRGQYVAVTGAWPL